MQIQHYQSIQSTASPTTNNTKANTPAEINEALIPKPQESVQVSISAQAQELAKLDNSNINNDNNKKDSHVVHNQATTLPEINAPEISGEKLEQAVQIKKAQLHYQAAADMANIVTGNNKGVSAAGAYYLSQNEDARELVLQSKSQQQNLANMQAYQEQTQSINEQYS